MNCEDHQHTNAGHKQGSGVEKKLLWAFFITFGIFITEVIGGFISTSLALQSDAGHLLGDVMALGLSLIAIRIARRPPSPRRTFGYQRAEVFAAIINGVTLTVLSGYIFIEAYHRLIEPEPIRSMLMLTVAIIGLAGNSIVIFRLHGHAKENINVRAAFLHVLGDMLASVGVVIGGLIMLFTGNYLADPIISFFIGIIILFGAFSILKEGANILLEGVPGNIDYTEIKTAMENIDGVSSVHDLHIWTISSSNLVLSAHVSVPDQPTHNSQRILKSVSDFLKDKYRIQHATLQIECECCAETDCGCAVF
ncbi:MAG: cation diffusion facilitator family transporter [candidate division Zixibacteria bacterium]